MSARTLVIALIAALAAYLLWQLFQYLRLRASAKPKSGLNFSEPHIAGGSHTDTDEDEDGAYGSLSAQTIPVDDPDDAPAAQTYAPSPRAAPRPPAEPDASQFGFDALLEMRQMRHLVDTQRARLDNQAEEIDRLRHAVDALQAAQHVAPLYSEAVALARRGHDADAIAERCGISVSEAELVRALSAKQEDSVA